jgi:hypothetical protein
MRVIRRRVSGDIEHSLSRHDPDGRVFRVEQCPFRAPSASNRLALPRRSPLMANAPQGRRAGRHCADELRHTAKSSLPSAPPWTLFVELLRRQPYGRVEKSLLRLAI